MKLSVVPTSPIRGRSKAGRMGAFGIAAAKERPIPERPIPRAGVPAIDEDEEEEAEAAGGGDAGAAKTTLGGGECAGELVEEAMAT